MITTHQIDDVQATTIWVTCVHSFFYNLTVPNPPEVVHGHGTPSPMPDIAKPLIKEKAAMEKAWEEVVKEKATEEVIKEKTKEEVVKEKAKEEVVKEKAKQKREGNKRQGQENSQTNL